MHLASVAIAGFLAGLITAELAHNKVREELTKLRYELTQASTTLHNRLGALERILERWENPSIPDPTR